MHHFTERFTVFLFKFIYFPSIFKRNVIAPDHTHIPQHFILIIEICFTSISIQKSIVKCFNEKSNELNITALCCSCHAPTSLFCK